MAELFEGAIAEGLVRVSEGDIERTTIWLNEQGIRALSVLKNYSAEYLENHICYPLVMGALEYQQSTSVSGG